MTLKSLIVDDEPMARKGLSEEVTEIGFIEICGTAENVRQAIRLMESVKIDLLFLDIEMPGINGLDFIKTLERPPMVIITTAYPEYALEGYGLDVIDYLVKPISFSRLLRSCRKAKELYDLKNQTPILKQTTENYFFIKYNGNHVKLFLDQILFVKGADNYITIYTLTQTYLIYNTLKSMTKYLPEDVFVKVHKSYIISVSKIIRVSGNKVFIDHYELPISRTYKEAVMKLIVGNKTINR